MLKGVFMSKVCVFVFFILFSCVYSADKYQTKDFSINPLHSEFNGEITQSVMMFLAPAEGFSANVNVQIQPYNDSIDSYFELSAKQMKQFKLKLLNSKKSATTLEMEYCGEMNGMNMHWYLLALKRYDRIYLVTATSLESQWEKNKNKLIECVKSFKFN